MMEDKETIEKSLFSDTSAYLDIMNQPRHVSKAHAPMTQEDRAAQFSPFAALTGYHRLLAEIGKCYQHKKYLTADELQQIKAELTKIENEKVMPRLRIEYFNAKNGFYEEYCGQLKRINQQSHQLLFKDTTEIPIQNIRKIKRDQ